MAEHIVSINSVLDDGFVEVSTHSVARAAKDVAETLVGQSMGKRVTRTDDGTTIVEYRMAYEPYRHIITEVIERG